MTVLVDARPSGLDALFPPGEEFRLRMNWPAGSLTGRTFAATLDADPLDLAVAGDQLTVTASAAQATAGGRFTLTDTTTSPGRRVLIGTWVPSTDPSVMSVMTVDVAEGTTEVAVTLIGDTNAEQARLEAYGSGVIQTMTTDYRSLFLAYIRNTGSSSPTAGRNFLGGDVVDAVQVTSSIWWWLCLDLWDGGTNVLDADDTFKTGTVLLPQRNGQIEETPQGTLTTQGYATAPSVLSGPFLNAITQGGHPAGYFWWTVGGVRPTIGSGNIYIVCYLIDQDDPTGPTHGVLGTELIAINAFGLYSHKISFITPGWSDANFYLSALRNDATDGFIYGQGTVINIGLDSPAISDVDGYRTHRGQARKIARVAPANIETPGSWQFWDGDSWSSNVADAAPQVDDRGSVIYGLTGNPVRVAPARWVTVGRANVLDPFLDVYASSQVQGPWTKIARVPAKGVGGTLGEADLTLASHHATIIPHIPAPADHSVAVMTCLGIGADPAGHWDEISIRRWCPLFVVVPHF